MLLAGAAEGFALLPNLRPAAAAVIAPSFTEPDAALAAAGVPVHHVVLRAAVRPGRRATCPTKPTWWWSAIRPTRRRCCIPASRSWRCGGPGRIVVVDEAFADAIPGEPESLAG